MLYTTHDVGEAERHADRVLVLADGELLYIGTPASWPATATSRRAFLRPVRWLLIKDLRILRRSPLLVGLLILYPVVVAILIGAALTGGPEKPRVAFANLAGRRRSSSSAARRSTRPPTRRASSRRSTRSASRPARRRSRRSATARRWPRSWSPPDAIAAPAGHALAGGRRAADGRGLLQRRGPGQAALRRVDDPLAAGRGRRGAQRRGAGAVGQVPRPRGQGRQAVVPARGRRADPRPAQRADADRHVAEGAPAGRAAARAAAAGQPLRAAGGREPRPEQADPGLDRPAGARQADGRQRLQDAAGPVRGGRRGDALADARDAAAGGRACWRSSARRACSRASSAGSCRAPRCWPRRSCWPRRRRSWSR